MIRIDFSEISFPIQGLEEVTLPRMARVRQLYARDRIEDISAHLKTEFAREDYASLVRGKRIVVTVGSHGSGNPPPHGACQAPRHDSFFIHGVPSSMGRRFRNTLQWRRLCRQRCAEG